LVEKIGDEAVREVILGILSGANVRDSTEMLTRRRVAMLNGALLAWFAKSADAIEDFGARAPGIAAVGLGTRRDKGDKWLLQWLLGLTDKGVQNVLRSDASSIAVYAGALATALREVADTADADFGPLVGAARVGDSSLPLSWMTALQLMTAVGAQTLTIRGSEKSLYGKLFERLILGAVLHCLGFEHRHYSEITGEEEFVFWLSSAEERRESDATLLLDDGRAIRFDIGFIGRGNPEITLDKVSRFEREVDFGRRTWHVATIILVDTVPKNSRLPELAAAIDGVVIQMSSGYWPRLLAGVLQDRFGVETGIAELDDAELRAELRERVVDLPLSDLLDIAAIDADEEITEEGE
jgi:hypothetical protein